MNTNMNALSAAFATAKNLGQRNARIGAGNILAAISKSLSTVDRHNKATSDESK